MIVAINATAYDGRPSGAVNRAVGTAAALLRAGVRVRMFVAPEVSLRERVVAEYGAGFPEDHFEQITSLLRSTAPARRWFSSRKWFSSRISRETDAFVTDYHPALLKLPTLVTVHDLRYFAARRYEPAPRAAFFRAVFPRIARRAARVVVPTAAVGREAVRFAGVDEARVVVAGNGLSRAWREAAPAEGPGEHFLAVGMDDRRKDLAVLLAAMRARPSAPPLVVVRRGGEVRTARDLVRAGRVRFVETPDDAELVSLCRRAAALLHPSRYEGFGMPVIEAMSVGVPVIAARQVAVEEVAGGFATLVAPGDATAWASAIESVAAPAPGAREHARGFTWEATAARIVEAVREASEA